MAKKGSPKTVKELAAALGMEVPLLGRLMRHVSAMGYIKEIGPDTYETTNFGRAQTIPIIGDGYPCM
jgi:hypothetical protein